MINPFENDIVTDPRIASPHVESLNREVMDEALRIFRTYTALPKPRNRVEETQKPRLVTSNAPGLGKSHFLTQVFKHLDDEATLIYVRPFQDPDTSWINILQKVVQELDYPDRADAVTRLPGEETQMDALVRHIIGEVVAQHIESGAWDLPNPQELAQRCRNDPKNSLSPDWLRTSRQGIMDRLPVLLKKAGIRLNASPGAWGKVLLAYLLEGSGSQLSQAGMDWICARPLEPEDMHALGLGPADAPPADAAMSTRNQGALERIQDLFQLASFYRPFVLCFDQTEFYGQNALLARMFGDVLSSLRRDFVNHLCIVTANRTPWAQSVSCHFEKAALDVIVSSPRLALKGITRRQAEELVRLRFGPASAGEDAAARVIRHQLFGELFEKSAENPVREVLRQCARIWDELESLPPPPPPDLATVFQLYRDKILSRPKAQAFDAGALLWFFERIPAAAADMEIRRGKSPKGYLSLLWKTEKQQRYFTFEESNNYSRWKAICGDGSIYHQQGHKHGRETKVLALRVPAQGNFTPGVGKLLDDQPFVVRMMLSDAEVADIYGAHDFYAAVKGGDHPEISEEEALDFLGKMFRPLRERIFRIDSLQPKAKPEPEPPKLASDELAAKIKNIVRAGRFVALAMLLQKLQEQGIQARRDDVVSAAGHLQPEVKIHASPSNLILQWNTPST